ncbi:hypothetical protein VAR608DRAFT_3287 [Variovorax sp. HW608]|nr:hypothetical protein VAR608DRAFT_3287 [Variovorax sp. HW608]
MAAAALSVLAMLVPACASADGVAKSSPARSQAGAPPMKSAPMKSSGSGVAVQYRVDGTPEVGTTVRVVLSFDGVTDPAGAALRFTTEGGLAMGATTPAAVTLPSGQATTITVEVVPSAQGIAYLHVFTTQNGATSATSIPVQVGKAPAALPATGELKQDAAGEKIRSMQVK